MFLYGASGHSKVIIDIIRAIGKKTIVVLFDDNPKFSEILGVPVTKDKSHFTKESEWIISIGNNAIRKKIAESLDVTFISSIHPNTIVSPSSTISEGTVVMPGVIINAEAFIGKHCIINSGAVIEHDCKIGDYSHISPNAALAGNVSVGEGTHIGIGASIIQGVTIGNWVTVGAGSVIINDVPDNVTVVGNPARIIKHHK